MPVKNKLPKSETDEVEKIAQKFFDKFKKEFLGLKDELLGLFREHITAIKQDFDKLNEDIKKELESHSRQIRENTNRIYELLQITTKHDKELVTLNKKIEDIEKPKLPLKYKILFICGVIYLVASLGFLVANLVKLFG